MTCTSQHFTFAAQDDSVFLFNISTSEAGCVRSLKSLVFSADDIMIQHESSVVTGTVHRDLDSLISDVNLAQPQPTSAVDDLLHPELTFEADEDPQCFILQPPSSASKYIIEDSHKRPATLTPHPPSELITLVPSLPKRQRLSNDPETPADLTVSYPDKSLTNGPTAITAPSGLSAAKSPAEKKRERLERNRESQRRSRERKRRALEEHGEVCAKLVEENQRLMRQIVQMEARMQELQDIIQRKAIFN